MSQEGSKTCGDQGEVWTTIIRRYYFDNGVQPGHVIILDDAPAATDYNEPGLGWRLWVFALNGNGAVRWNKHVRSSNLWYGWNIPANGDGVCTSPPAAMAYSTNHLWLSCRNTGGGISAKRYNGSSWESWIDLGGVGITGPAVTEYGSSLRAFVVGLDNSVWQRSCPAASSNCSLASNWTAWQHIGPSGQAAPPGGCTSSPAADWRINLYVFCRGIGSASSPLAPIWYTQFNGSTWSSWAVVPNGGLVSAPAATDFYLGGWRIYVHSNTEPGFVWQAFRTSDSGAWSPWYRPFLDGYCTSSPANSNLPPADDYLFVLCRSGSVVFSRRWNTSIWENWQNLGAPP